ncbi:MAG: hypothetical protein QXH45_00510 [Thermosphaera sp.]
MSERPHALDTILSLTRMASTISVLFAVVLLIIGIATIFIVVGFFVMVIAIIDFVVYYHCTQIIDLIQKGKFKEAKNLTLTDCALGFIFGGVVVGALLLAAYVKYDDLMTSEGATPI